MVTTKHCCYGVCRSDSHYGHREHMQGVGPNMHSGRSQSLKWTAANASVGRESFGTDKVTKHTYICSLSIVLY